MPCTENTLANRCNCTILRYYLGEFVLGPKCGCQRLVNLQCRRAPRPQHSLGEAKHCTQLLLLITVFALVGQGRAALQFKC